MSIPIACISSSRPVELDIIVDALRSVGNVELAARLEAVLHKLGESSGRERHA